MIESRKEFMMCPHPLFLEASLDKGVSTLYTNQGQIIYILVQCQKVVTRIARVAIFSTFNIEFLFAAGISKLS